MDKRTQKLIKEKISDALIFLEEIGALSDQKNDRSALCLLALADIKPESNWSDIKKPLIGITQMMDWFRDNYDKKYAPNTRETVRRQTIHQFVQMGIIVANPDDPKRAINSPKTHYQLSDQGYKLLCAYKTIKWNSEKKKYLKSSKNRLKEKHRNLPYIPIRLNNGEKIQLTAGGQNQLIKLIVEEFCPRYTPGARILYLGDAGQKFIINDVETFKEIGINIDIHGKMPDVIVYYEIKKWLVFVEAVTSHGPVDLKRKNELMNIFESSGMGLVFITAFNNRRAMVKYLNSISWETEVWLAEDPEHLIHFNGEKFLGPYESNT